MSNEISSLARGWTGLVAAICLGTALVSVAAESPVDEAATAKLLFDNGNAVAALPYYERLARNDPQNPLYAERHAFAMLTLLTGMPAGEKRAAIVEQIKAEALRAKALGDNSNLLNTLLASMDSVSAYEPSKEAQEVATAEAAFQRGDYDKALAGYEAVAAANPLSYSARLFAGDVHYIRGNVDAAAKWFQAAIDLNPNIEQAHRYWGDALAKAKREDEALGHYIDAFIAEPYNRNAQTGLKQWADRNGVQLRKPSIPVPPAPTVTQQENAKPAVTINIGSSTMQNPRTGAAWLLYATTRATWMTGEFAKQFPQEQKYRHSLMEESDALQFAYLSLKLDDLDLEGADSNVRDLVKLGKAGMIKAYILLQAPDEGIAQDYNAYRIANRDKLVAYFRQFVIPPK
jgi:tetratricopeptide (TPR) repeat protein